MAQDIKVNLSFTADTTQAKRQIQELQTALMNVSKLPSKESSLFDDKALKEASQAAIELQQHLNQAVNVNTGKLDLSRFSTSLKASNTDLSSYYDKLSAIGKDGQEAFLKLARAISTAEAPVTRVSKRMDEFLTTLKNTAKWQISSSIMHGFVGTLQSAYSYAKDLDKSLNDIRIVSGESAEKMAAFAKQANEAAKSLSATTLAYTDASLIFYQQGLSGAEVTERTNAVIKMSNVTGESVSDVASYMTSIWNNFDGTYDRLEKYADIITALGAATASSSEEIAGGLEQFAAVADTVGLSYEYAASALATVVATTRQSESVVGNAFRTIFSRLQGLSLGETLEDGVDLNKYSKALKAVGVDILDVTGNVKDLDTILDDLADKWDNLSEAQQVALAQTVGGARQYAQLISLMDNWDFMEENLATAKNSDGALQEQSEIYAESWEAARKRVQAALQGLYDELIDEEFFIKIADYTTKIVEGITSVIDKMGGVKGLLISIASVFMTQYANKVPSVLDNLKQNFMVITGQANKVMTQLQKENQNKIKNYSEDPSLSNEMKVQLTASLKLSEMQERLSMNQKYMTQEQQESYRIKMQAVKLGYEETAELAKQLDLLKQQKKELGRQVLSDARNSAKKTITDYETSRKVINASYTGPNTVLSPLQQEKYDRAITTNVNSEDKLKDMIGVLETRGITKYNKNLDWTKDKGKTDKFFEDVQNCIINIQKEIDNLTIKIAKYNSIQNEGNGAVEQWQKEAKEIENNSEAVDTLKNKIQGYLNTTKQKLQKDGSTLDIEPLLSELAQITDKTGLEQFLIKLKTFFNSTLETEIGNTEGKVNELNNSLGIFSNKAEDFTNKAGAAADKASQLGDGLRNANEQVRQGVKVIPTTSQVFTQFASAVMATANAINTFKNIAKDFQSGNLSFSSIASGLTTIVFGLNAVITAIQALSKAILKVELEIPQLAIAALLFTGLSIAVSFLIDQYNKWKQEAKDKTIESQLERVNESVESLQAAFEEATTAAENFKDAVSGYDSAINELSELEKGTKNYKKQIEEANEKARELIETYQLFDQFHYDENGLIVFNPGALDNKKTELDKAKATAQYNVDAEKYRQNAVSTEASVKKLAEQNTSLTSEDLQEIYQSTRFITPEAYDDSVNILKEDKKREYEKEYSEKAAEFIQNTDYTDEQIDAAIAAIKNGTVEQQEDIVKNLAETFEIIGKENVEYVRGLRESYLGKSDYYYEQLYADDAAINNKFEGNSVAQQAYANYASLMGGENLQKGIKEAQEKAANATAEELAEIYGLDFVDAEKTARLAAQNLQGWTENEANNAAWDSEAGTLTSGDKTYTSDEKTDREALYFSEALKNKNLFDNTDITQAIDNILKNTTGEVQDAVLQAISNGYKEGNDFHVELNSANLDEESFYSAKDALENFSKEKGLKFDGDQTWNADKYWNAREAEQTATIDQQITDNELDADVLETQAELLQKNTENLENDANAAKQLAVNNARMNEGLETLIDNWEDWSKVLKSNDKTTTEYAETITELRNVLGDLTGLTDDLSKNLSLDFFDKSAGNLELLEKAVKGDTDAIEQLGFEAAKNVLENTEAIAEYGVDKAGNLVDEVVDINDPSKLISVDQFDQNFKSVVSRVSGYMDNLQQAVANGSMEMGQSLADCLGDDNLADFVSSLNEYAKYTQMSVQDMNSMLSSMGVTANVGVDTITTHEDIPVYKTTITKDGDGSLSDFFEGKSDSFGYHSETVVDDYKNLETKKQVASINYDSSGKFPSANIKYTGHGGVSAGNKAKASGGGGGSSSKPSQKDHKDKINEEAELFHNVKESISDLEHAMNKLSKAQDHLAGGALISALKQENDYLENQIELYGQYNDEIDERQNFLTSELSSFGDPEDYYGTYQSIEDAYNKAIDDYNAVVDKYNAMSKDEQEASGDTMLDNAEDVLNDAKEAYDQANEDLKEYYSNKDLRRQNEEKKLEALYNQIENNLKAFEVQLELDLDIEDAQRTVNDFINKTQKDFKKIYTSAGDWSREFTTNLKNATSYSNTIATDLQAIQDVKDIIDDEDYDYLSSDSMFGSQSEAIQYLEELEKTVMEDGESLYDLYSTAWDSYLSAMDDVVSQWEDIIDDFDEINDTLDHYQKIAELLYGGDEVQAGRDYLDQIYAASAQNSLAKQSTLAQEIEALGKERAELLAAGADEADQDIQKIDEAIQSANQELQSEIESYVDTIQNQFTNAIASIMAAADKTLSQGYGLETLSERWQKAQDAAEGYYDDVERIFELESLESKWEDLINSTSTLKNQQYLKTIMDAQLQNLQNKTKLSEYDIGLAEKELAIYQAQIALEEAQNSKNTMKLMRNEAGNWTYNYVADDDDVADKQESLLTSLQDKYEYVKSASEEATEQVLELYQTAQEELTALMEEYKIADETRRAELEGEYEYLYNYYYGVDGLIVQKTAEANQMQQDLNTATMESTWGLYEVDQDNFQIMTENEQALIEELRDNSIESLRELLETVATDDGSFYNQMQEKCAEVCADSQGEWKSLANDIIATWAEDPDSVRAVISGVYDDIMDKVAEYDLAIAESEEASKQSWSNIGDAVNDVRDDIDEVLGRVNAVANSTAQLDIFRQAVDNIKKSWDEVSDAIGDAIDNLEDYLSMLEEGVDIEDDDYEADEDSFKPRGVTKTKNPSSSRDPSSLISPPDDEGSNDIHGILFNKGLQNYYVSRYGAKGYTSVGTAVQSLEAIEKSGSSFADDLVLTYINGKYYIASKNKNSSYNVGWRAYEAYDTGGYTGDWSDGSGKLAMLHSKEIVLNKEDTANLLSAVESVRSITSLGSNIASSISSGIASLIGKMLNFNTNLGSIGTTTTPAAENNNVFNINAEFPNANNAEEIREAIMSLPTLASQYLSQRVL